MKTVRCFFVVCLFAVTSLVRAGGWDGFVYPEVVFDDQATHLPGSQILKTAVPDVAAMMRETCLEVCKKLFHDNDDDRVNFRKLNLLLEDDPQGVAWKAGDPPEIWIGVSAQYLNTFFKNNGNSYEAVKKEVQGMLAHEATHGYQYAPKNCGSYDGSSEFFAFIEGMADYVRGVTYNYSPARYPREGGDWHHGYNVCGFFLEWIVANKSSTFAIDFNHLAGSMRTFSWDAAMIELIGQGVDQTWSEYQDSFRNISAVRPFAFRSGAGSDAVTVRAGAQTGISITCATTAAGVLRCSFYSVSGRQLAVRTHTITHAGTHHITWENSGRFGVLASTASVCHVVAPGLDAVRTVYLK